MAASVCAAQVWSGPSSVSWSGIDSFHWPDPRRTVSTTRSGTGTAVRSGSAGTETHGFVVLDSHDQKGISWKRTWTRTRTGDDSGRGGRGQRQPCAARRDSLAVVAHSLAPDLRSLPSLRSIRSSSPPHRPPPNRSALRSVN